MIKLRHLLYEDNSSIILSYFEKLKKLSSVDLGGGNCGQVAYAIMMLLKYRGINVDIGILTNAETEEELINGDPDVYHVYLISDNKKFDEMGEINDTYLLELAWDQYRNNNPNVFVFDMPDEQGKIEKIIKFNTNYNMDWAYFYKLIKK